MELFSKSEFNAGANEMQIEAHARGHIAERGLASLMSRAGGRAKPPYGRAPCPIGQIKRQREAAMGEPNY
jgi:hypothetical protein